MTSPAVSYKDRYTYQDYLSWPDGERWELIEGVAYNMSPAPNEKHQRISQNLSSTIWAFLKGKTCRVYSAPFDVRLPEPGQSADETDTVVQPGISVFCDTKKLDNQGAVGAPDWVIEILSPSTATKDLNLKLLLYQTHGVGEYWIVDPETERVLVHHFDTKLKRYTLPHTFERTDTLGSITLPEFTVELETLFQAAE